MSLLILLPQLVQNENTFIEVVRPPVDQDVSTNTVTSIRADWENIYWSGETAGRPRCQLILSSQLDQNEKTFIEMMIPPVEQDVFTNSVISIRAEWENIYWSGETADRPRCLY